MCITGFSDILEITRKLQCGEEKPGPALVPFPTSHLPTSTPLYAALIQQKPCHWAFLDLGPNQIPRHGLSPTSLSNRRGIGIEICFSTSNYSSASPANLGSPWAGDWLYLNHFWISSQSEVFTSPRTSPLPFQAISNHLQPKQTFETTKPIPQILPPIYACEKFLKWANCCWKAFPIDLIMQCLSF